MFNGTTLKTHRCLVRMKYPNLSMLHLLVQTSHGLPCPVIIHRQNMKRKVRSQLICKVQSYWPRGYKNFPCVINSSEYEIYPAHNVKMPSIVGILTFISMINPTPV